MHTRSASIASPALATAAFRDSIEIVQRLVGIAKGTRALLSLKLGLIGLRAGSDELLMALGDEAAVTISQLADRLNVRPSTVSKTVERLCQLGLVERSADNRDSRRAMVRITEEGLHVQSQVEAIWRELGVELTKDLGIFDADDMCAQLVVTESVIMSRLSKAL